MANEKQLVIYDTNSDNHLKLYLYKDKEIYMQIGDMNNDIYCKWITLNREDAIALFNELEMLLNKI